MQHAICIVIKNNLIFKDNRKNKHPALQPIEDITEFQVRIAAVNICKTITYFQFRGKCHKAHKKVETDACFYSKIVLIQFDEVIGIASLRVAGKVNVIFDTAQKIDSEVINPVTVKFELKRKTDDGRR